MESLKGFDQAHLRVRPQGSPIDALSSPQISHWDETVDAGKRTITVYFTQKTLGAMPVLPETLDGTNVYLRIWRPRR